MVNVAHKSRFPTLKQFSSRLVTWLGEFLANGVRSNFSKFLTLEFVCIYIDESKFDILFFNEEFQCSLNLDEAKWTRIAVDGGPADAPHTPCTAKDDPTSEVCRTVDCVVRIIYIYIYIVLIYTLGVE